MTSSQKPVDDIICSGVTPFLLFSQYGILYAEHQNIFPFRKLLFYSAQYFPVSEAKPHKPQLHFGLHLGAVCGSCGMRHSFHASFRWAKKRANQRIITCINSLKIILIRMCFSHFPQRKEAPFITHLLFSVQSKKSRTSSSNRFACGHFATTSSQFSQTVSINFSYVRFSFLGRFLIFTP